MRTVIISIALSICSLNALSQSSKISGQTKANQPASLIRKADGYWYEVSKQGTVEKIKIDSSQIVGFSQLYNKVNSRTLFHNLSALRASKIKRDEAPGVISLSQKGMTGTFVLDPQDSSTPDNTGRVIVTASGCRYRRIINGGVIELAWYGAKGDGVTDDTQAVQNAINDALSAAPATNTLPTYGRSGATGTLLIPVGTFKISTVKINGSIRILGQGGGTYSGSFFLQKNPGISMFLLGPDVDKQSNSTVIESICFKSASGSSSQDVAQIKTVSNIQSNSVYIRNCWFQTPETYAIWLTQGDDIQISGCTFDVCPMHAIRLGTVNRGHVSNCTITNNTFYRVSINHIKIENALGVVISNNRVNNNPNEIISTATFVNGAGATKIEGLAIVGNEYNSVPRFVYVETTAKALIINANSGYNTNGFFLCISGGGILYGASVTGNAVYSKGNWASAPILGPGCGLQSSVIIGNTFFSTTNSELGINLSDNRTMNNIINKNVFTNFHQIDDITNKKANGQDLYDLTDLESGDMLFFDGTKLKRIPKGNDGQLLKMVSGAPKWAN